MRLKNKRKLSEQELKELQNDTILAIEYLCEGYDAGRQELVFLIASEIKKLLVDNKQAVALRNLLKFPTRKRKIDRRFMSPSHQLIVMRSVTGVENYITFKPWVLEEENEYVSFVDWWSRETIYCSATTRFWDGKSSSLEVFENQVWEEREKLTRLQLILEIRNKLGSHQDDNIPLLFDELRSASSFIHFEINTPNGKLSTFDGTLEIRMHPLGAMVRAIAEEVLVAFGRR